MNAARLLAAAILAGLIGLSACRPSSTPTPTAVPSASVAPTARSPATPTARPTATGAPEEWVRHIGDAFTIALPRAWQAGQPVAAVAELREHNPELARLLDGPESYRVAVFQATDAGSPATGFADNLNVRRIRLDGEGPANLADMAGLIAEQYRRLGFDVQAADAGLQAGAYPAARIIYAFAVETGSETVMAAGVQYLVATAGDVWLLSYTTTADRLAEVGPTFEQSASSFEAEP